MKQIAESDCFTHLEYLKLRNCKISNEGMKYLFESRWLKRVKILVVSKNYVSVLEGPFGDLKMVNDVQKR